MCPVKHVGESCRRCQNGPAIEPLMICRRCECLVNAFGQDPTAWQDREALLIESTDPRFEREMRRWLSDW